MPDAPPPEQTPLPKINWDNLASFTPEQREAARVRLERIRHEFAEVYSLTWTEDLTVMSRRRRARVSCGSFHTEVQDHGPLSYWELWEETPGGARTRVGGGDSSSYAAAKVEAAEELLVRLDVRAAAVAEALREPEGPLTGSTSIGGSGSVSFFGAFTRPMQVQAAGRMMATGPVGPVRYVTLAAPGPAAPGPAGAPPAAPPPGPDPDEP